MDLTGLTFMNNFRKVPTIIFYLLKIGLHAFRIQ